MAQNCQIIKSRCRRVDKRLRSLAFYRPGEVELLGEEDRKKKNQNWKPTQQIVLSTIESVANKKFTEHNQEWQ